MRFTENTITVAEANVSNTLKVRPDEYASFSGVELVARGSLPEMLVARRAWGLLCQNATTDDGGLYHRILLLERHHLLSLPVDGVRRTGILRCLLRIVASGHWVL